MTLAIVEAVRLRDQLIEARRCARFLLGAGYRSRVQPYRELIARVATDEGVEILSAAIRVGSAIPESDAIPLMLVLAAALDEVEERAAQDLSGEP